MNDSIADMLDALLLVILMWGAGTVAFVMLASPGAQEMLERCWKRVAEWINRISEVL